MSQLIWMPLSNSVSECSLFTSGFDLSPFSSGRRLSVCRLFCDPGFSWAGLDVLNSFAVVSLVSSSLSDSPDELISWHGRLFFLCFFLLFFFLLFLCRRCDLLPLGVLSPWVGLLGLFSRLSVLLLPSLLELLDFTLIFLGLFVSLSLLLHLRLSGLLLPNLSDTLSLLLLLLLLLRLALSLVLLLLLLLLLLHQPLLLSLRPVLALRRHSASLQLKDLSDLAGLLLRWRCLHERSRCFSERSSLRLPLTLRSGDRCRSRSASQNSFVGFRKTWRKLQCFPLGHFRRSNNPER